MWRPSLRTSSCAGRSRSFPCRWWCTTGLPAPWRYAWASRRGFRNANTIVDLRYNNDELEDPFINRDHAVALRLATYQELDVMYDIARKANDLLKELFHRAGIELVDMKIEFGRASDNGEIIISDEISPDTCRLWDEESGERLDKDRFRLDLGDVAESYRTVLERLEKVLGIDEEE